MRKTDLTNAALSNAVSEMETGLIDADLRGGIAEKRVALPGRVKEEVHAHWWQRTKEADGFLFSVSRKTNARTSARRSWKHCRLLPSIC